MPTHTILRRRLAAEFLGTSFLLAIIVGSGIMGDRLAGGNEALALLCNSTATALGLFALIVAFGDASGAHFNPAVTVLSAWGGGMHRRDVLPYIGVQCLGALVGVALAHMMFELPLFSVSMTARADAGLFVSEILATGGLLLVISLGSHLRPASTPAAVGAYIGSAY